MGDTVFVNGRAAVHKGSSGKSIAFPDVCLCPPTPPAGPIPTPLPNNVSAADLQGGASSVLVEGKPMGKQSSFLAKSSGNEASQSTGGGVVTHAVQGKAYFASYSMDVLVEGEPVVRALDLVTHNHAGMVPGNTPPVPWLAPVDVPATPLQQASCDAGEGNELIVLELVDQKSRSLRDLQVEIETPAGKRLSIRTPAGGRIAVRGLKKGQCKVIVLDSAGAPMKEIAPKRLAMSAATKSGAKAASLPVGKEHQLVCELPSMTIELACARAPRGRYPVYVLTSAEGSYRQSRSFAEDLVPGEVLQVVFHGLPQGGTFTLKRVDHPGHEHVVFQDLPYADIVDQDA